MASSLWVIEYNGIRKTAAAWGVNDLTRRRRSLEIDELTFRVPRPDIFEACPFVYNQPLKLWRGGVCWFVGKVQVPAATGEAGSESWFITVANAWLTLQQIVYRQYRTLKNSDFSGLEARLSTQIVLGQDPWGRKRSTDWVIANIANFALTQAGGAYVVSAIDAGITPPYQEARDITCAAAILRQLEWTPDAASYCSYATNPPALFIRRRGGMGYLALDLDTMGLLGIESLRCRNDLVPNGVVFTFATLETNALTGAQESRNTEQIAGFSSGPGVIFATFQLAPGEEIPPGLAAAYYNSLITPFWDGSLSFVEGECTGFAQPGQLLQMVNGNPAWAAMNAIINEVIEDIDKGMTTINLGVPATLGANDFRDLMARGRDSEPPTDDVNKNHNGTEGVPEENGGPGPAPALPGDPSDENGKVPEDARSGNSNAGKISGLIAVSGPAFEAEFCIDGEAVKKTVVGC